MGVDRDRAERAAPDPSGRAGADLRLPPACRAPAQLPLVGCVTGLLISVALTLSHPASLAALTICMRPGARIAETRGAWGAGHDAMLFGALAGAAISLWGLLGGPRAALRDGVCGLAMSLAGMSLAMGLADKLPSPALAPGAAFGVASSLMLVAMGLGHWAGLQASARLLAWGARRPGDR